jgi:hypothetical protein
MRLRTAFLAVALIVAVAPRHLLGRGQQGQQGAAVPTRVGIHLGRLAGVVGATVMTIGESEGKKVEATSRPVVRSNTAWRLRVTLQQPVDPNLEVTVEGGDEAAVTLSARTPSAIVAVGRKACVHCEVPLEWHFVLAAPVTHGKKALPPALPIVLYTAEPAP